VVLPLKKDQDEDYATASSSASDELDAQFNLGMTTPGLRETSAHLNAMARSNIDAYFGSTVSPLTTLSESLSGLNGSKCDQCGATEGGYLVTTRGLFCIRCTIKLRLCYSCRRPNQPRGFVSRYGFVCLECNRNATDGLLVAMQPTSSYRIQDASQRKPLTESTKIVLKMISRSFFNPGIDQLAPEAKEATRIGLDAYLSAITAKTRRASESNRTTVAP